jgi:hypothetical protein
MTALTLNIASVSLLPVRTLSAPNGVTVETRLSYRDAFSLCAFHRSAFAAKLVALAPSSLTKNQAIYVYQFAEEVLAAYLGATPAPAPEVPAAPVAEPAPVPSGPVSFAPIVSMFAVAIAKGAKRLRIRMNIGGTCFALSPAANPGKNAGSLYVTSQCSDDDGTKTYYGRITPEGGFLPTRETTPEIIAALETFAGDPVKAAAEYGQRTGTCCFCGRLLTDDSEGSSVTVGYGPICAAKYSLPHAGAKKGSAE